MSALLDVLIIGGGPAGLSAALVLGRCRRRVLLIDNGHPRNAATRTMHGFLSRDGAKPSEFLATSREQLANYPNIEMLRGRAVKADRGEQRFTVTLEDGTTQTARILLIATGLRDMVPTLPGFDELYGKSVHLCPYCDGWEHRDEPIAVYGKGQAGADLALEMLGWTEHITLFTDGEKLDVPTPCQLRLGRHHIPVYEERVRQLEGTDGQISGVRLESGELVPCKALFFAAEQEQCSDLVAQLGCQICSDTAAVEHEDTRATGVPGLYVAGNTSRGLQLVIMAAASGTLAAFNINEALLDADLAASVGE